MRISDWSSDVCSSDLQDVRARDAAVQHVAADRDRQPLDPSQPAADGQRVEQRLRRMLVAAVAGVEHRAIDLVGDQLHRARRRMADHDRSEEHTSELQSLMRISYAVFCLKKKN